MKFGIVSALSIAMIWSLIAIAQLWIKPLSGEVFVKVSITAVILEGIILIVTLAVKEYLSEKKLKDKEFIDG